MSATVPSGPTFKARKSKKTYVIGISVFLCIALVAAALLAGYLVLCRQTPKSVAETYLDDILNGQFKDASKMELGSSKTKRAKVMTENDVYCLELSDPNATTVPSRCKKADKKGEILNPSFNADKINSITKMPDGSQKVSFEYWAASGDPHKHYHDSFTMSCHGSPIQSDSWKIDNPPIKPVRFTIYDPLVTTLEINGFNMDLTNLQTGGNSNLYTIDLYIGSYDNSLEGNPHYKRYITNPNQIAGSAGYFNVDGDTTDKTMYKVLGDTKGN